jgi:hypothetical protein
MPRRSVPSRGPERRAWSLLIFIAGDNNLSDNGLQDVNELCREGGSRDVHVGVEIDTRGEFSGSIRYEIGAPDWAGKAHRTVVERLREQDTGDPETMRRFARWGLTRYPADSTVLVVWGHGNGFRRSRKDVAPDDFGSSLDMPELKGALRKAGVGPRRKLAILGFDACLMNMVEIAYQFRDQAEFVVGSQQTEPGDGWAYDAVLALAKRVPSRSAMAKGIVEAYIRSYRRQGESDVTQSAVETARAGPALQALSGLGRALKGRIAAERRALQRLRVRLQAFDEADYVDLVHLAELVPTLVRAPAVRQAAAVLASAGKACVLRSDRIGRGVRNAHGTSVWFPSTLGEYQAGRSKYLALDFASTHRGWIELLDAYHAA